MHESSPDPCLEHQAEATSQFEAIGSEKQKCEILQEPSKMWTGPVALFVVILLPRTYALLW